MQWPPIFWDKLKVLWFCKSIKMKFSSNWKSNEVNRFSFSHDLYDDNMGWDGLRICMLIWVFVYFHITYIHSVKRKNCTLQRAVSVGIIGGKSKKLKQNISCKGFLRRFKCKKKHSKIPNIKQQPVQCTQDRFHWNKHCLDTASVSDYKKVGSYKSFSQNSHRAFLFWKPFLVLLRTSCS